MAPVTPVPMHGVTRCPHTRLSLGIAQSCVGDTAMAVVKPAPGAEASLSQQPSVTKN